MVAFLLLAKGLEQKTIDANVLKLLLTLYCQGLAMRKLLLSLLLLFSLGSSVQAQMNTDVVINEVFYGGSSTQDWIELKNTGSGSINVSTWWFCSRFAYRQVGSQTILVGDDYVLQPGEILVVGAGVDLNGVAGADLGLYQVNNFGDPNQMVDFVQWGTDLRVGRSNEAQTRGVWMTGQPTPVDFVPLAQPGESTVYCGSNSGGGLLTLSNDFMTGAPSQGAENDMLCMVQEVIFADGFEEII